MKEKWLAWPECPDYLVSNMGRVKRIVPRQKYYGHILSFHRRKRSLKDRDFARGVFVNLTVNGKAKTKSAHRLVLETFKPAKKPNLRPYWKNGDDTDNRLCNLGWEVPYCRKKKRYTPPRNPEEKWKTHPVYKNYMISTHGRVYSKYVSRILAPPRKGAKNRITVSPVRDGRYKQPTVARLVLETFVGPPPHPIFNARRINGKGNHLENLEWASPEVATVRFDQELARAKGDIDRLAKRVIVMTRILDNLPKIKYYSEKLKIGRKEVKQIMAATISQDKLVRKLGKEMERHEF
jgi:hypothetical protein